MMAYAGYDAMAFAPDYKRLRREKYLQRSKAISVPRHAAGIGHERYRGSFDASELHSHTYPLEANRLRVGSYNRPINDALISPTDSLNTITDSVSSPDKGKNGVLNKLMGFFKSKKTIQLAADANDYDGELDYAGAGISQTQSDSNFNDFTPPECIMGSSPPLKSCLTSSSKHSSTGQSLSSNPSHSVGADSVLEGSSYPSTTEVGGPKKRIRFVGIVDNMDDGDDDDDEGLIMDCDLPDQSSPLSSSSILSSADEEILEDEDIRTLSTYNTDS